MSGSGGQKSSEHGLVSLAVARTRLKFEPLRGINVHAINVKDPVQVRTSGTTSGTRVAEDVAALHLRAGNCDQLGHVEIHGLEALAVVNADGVAEYVELLGESDGAGGYRTDWLTEKDNKFIKQRYVPLADDFKVLGSVLPAGGGNFEIFHPGRYCIVPAESLPMQGNATNAPQSEGAISGALDGATKS